MALRYRFGPDGSRFTVQAFPTGMLSFLGHSPTFAVRDFAGEVAIPEGRGEEATAVLAARADSLTVVGDVSPSDRSEIERRMRQEVLEPDRYPEIRYESTAVSAVRLGGDRYRLRIDGRLVLRGVARPHPVEAEMALTGDAMRVTGESVLRQSEYGIPPVTALGGSIRLKDQLRVAFDLLGRLARPDSGSA